MIRQRNHSVGLVATVEDTAGGVTEEQMAVAVRGVQLKSQSTYGAGCHRVVSFLGDMHIFAKRKLAMLVLDGVIGLFHDMDILTKRKLAVFVLDGHSCHTGMWTKDLMNMVMGGNKFSQKMTMLCIKLITSWRGQNQKGKLAIAQPVHSFMVRM
jgi:hypothetical protein